VVGVGRMPHPQEETEKQEGHDVQGGSGHCTLTKIAFRGDYYVSSEIQSVVYARHGRFTRP
jgi:hypothetical protein